jgi:hypothetical protein
VRRAIPISDDPKAALEGAALGELTAETLRLLDAEMSRLIFTLSATMRLSLPSAWLNFIS